MARTFFFLLLISSSALGAHIYLSETRPANAPPREVNPDALRIVSLGRDAVPAPVAVKVASTQAAAPPLPTTNQTAARESVCMALTVKPVDAARIEAAIAESVSADRVTRKNIEEFSKYLVALPPFDSRKAATDVVAQLKKAGVKQIQLTSNNGIALGAFTSEADAVAHQRALTQRAGALVSNTLISPRAPVVTETLFSLRGIDANTALRLTARQREVEGSTLKEIACAAPLIDAPPATVARSQ